MSSSFLGFREKADTPVPASGEQRDKSPWAQPPMRTSSSSQGSRASMSRTNGSSSASAFNVSPWEEEQGPESFAKSHPLAPSLVRDGARHQATPGVRRKQERRRSEQRRETRIRRSGEHGHTRPDRHLRCLPRTRASRESLAPCALY